MKRKIGCVILIGMFTFSCFACGSTNDSLNKIDVSNITETEDPTIEPTQESTVEPTQESTKTPSIDPKTLDFDKINKISSYYMDKEYFSNDVSLISELSKIVKRITPYKQVEPLDGGYQIYLYQDNTIICCLGYNGAAFIFDDNWYQISNTDAEKFREIARAIIPKE